LDVPGASMTPAERGNQVQQAALEALKAPETPPPPPDKAPAVKLPPTPAAAAAGDPAASAAATTSPAVAQSLARTRPGSDERMMLLALMMRAAAGSANPTGNMKFVEMLAGIEKSHQDQFEKTKTILSPQELAAIPGFTPKPGAIYQRDAFGNISVTEGAAQPKRAVSPQEIATLLPGFTPKPGVGYQIDPATNAISEVAGAAEPWHIMTPAEVKAERLTDATVPGRVWARQGLTGKPEPIDAPDQEKVVDITPAQQAKFPGAIAMHSGGKKDGQPFYPPAAIEKSPEMLYNARLPVAQKLGLQQGTPEFNTYMATGTMPKVELSVSQQKLVDESNKSLAAIDENLATVENAIEQAKAGKMNFGVTGRVAQALSGLPGMGTEASANTAAIDADIQNTILGNLRTIFGGQVRVSEMNRAMGLKPSTTQSQAEFLAKAQDYTTHLRNLQAQEQRRNAAMSNGSFWQKGAGAGSPAALPTPVAPGSPAGRAQQPAQAQPVPTETSLPEGTPAYGPGGKQLVVKDGRWQPR
jgi:hypothetical protein